MFAGIVEGAREIIDLKKREDGLEFDIDLTDLSDDLKVGGSVAIDGVCLTVIALTGTRARFHAMQETLRKTTLGTVRPGSKLNIERSLRVGDRIDGHFVQGHVFGIGTVTKRIDTKEEFKLWIDAGSLAKYIVPVGSIAVNGTSLTIAETNAGQFAVALIPITRERTNLGDLVENDAVNLEPDIIARQIVNFLENKSLSV